MPLFYSGLEAQIRLRPKNLTQVARTVRNAKLDPGWFGEKGRTLVFHRARSFARYKPKYNFTILIGGSLFDWGSAKASALFTVRKARLVHAFDDFSH